MDLPKSISASDGKKWFPTQEDQSIYLTPEIPPASLDAYAADKLTDETQSPEFFKLFKAAFMVKIFFLIFYGPSGTKGKTAEAFAAISLYGFIRLEGHIREHGDKPELRPKIGVNEKVVSSNPA